ncbi:hypothetical protein I8U24_10450 [Thermoactinomyces sp. CICC 24226]|nr:hypothetical protein [Thermoactinomyces sp. CICC 24226]
MYKKDQKIDLVTLTMQLDEYKRLNEIGGDLYLRELLNTVNHNSQRGILREHRSAKRNQTPCDRYRSSNSSLVLMMV